MENNSKDFKEKTKDLLNNVKDESKSFDKKDIDSGKGMAILSYIIPPIPYFVEKNNKYVRYHAVQGMNLLLVAIAYGILRWLLSTIYVSAHCGGGLAGKWCRELIGGWYLPWYLNIPVIIIGIGITILCIIGIMNSCNGKAKELPIVNKVKIFKK